MRHALKLHPDFPCTAVTHIDVEVARPRPGHLELRYVVTGAMSDLRLPPVTAPLRRDELWKHTCFEAFVRAGAETAYYELNFAPSTHWAAYRFSGYRSEMRVAREIGAPRLDVQSNAEHCEVRASLEGLPRDGLWRLALSAVIEEASGRKSYWALAHAPGPPDFHHSDCFVLDLPAA